MQTISQTFAAPQVWTLYMAGKYFTVIGADAPVNVRFFKSGKKLDLGDISGVLGGLEVTLGDMHDTEPAFDQVQLDVPAGAVSIGIGNGQARYNRQNATVQITNTGGAMANAQATVTNASTQLLVANATRRYVLIQNKDAIGNIWVNLGGATATQANGIKIPPGGNIEVAWFAPTSAITAIGDLASNANIVVVTG